MSRLTDWAQKELDMIAPNDPVQQEINKDIFDIVEKFSEQGHSGFSGGYALSIIRRLLDWKPIKPLTGDESEWAEPHPDGVQQNKRCTAVFRKNGDNSTAYYIFGKTFSDDGGKSWFYRSESFVNIAFPYYVPDESERIILKETGGDSN
ncbi:hypothetical protein LVN35_000119 [Listeria monocytogenes]|nr:hypothetical protein [Listeria monocytogenes]EIQ6425977.1 hypothetical protein [Listeria monocytogenes]EIQ6465978.1 hypothetical protein [Listeria monocytogenes]EIQ6471766.1 hypothetical protein [Listeria monocytogenes]EJH5327722.1 hypothetical protein [Listeria monocytogenes]